MKQLGRYDFPDGGSYCGEWLDGKFQGYGICTGPMGRGRYSGKWLNGYETCGVYAWTNGQTYEGSWSSGKRHGMGVENKEKWVYKGEWTRGMKGRYGARYSKSSKACYEGTWSTGLQDGYGVETYADGGTYQGQWFQGMRHGHGVRESVAYDQAVLYKPQLKFHKFQPRNRTLDSSYNSLCSDPETRFDLMRRDQRLEQGRGGFVLEQTVSNRDGGSLGGYSSRSGDEASVDSTFGENLTKTLVKTLKLKKKTHNNSKTTVGSVRSLASASSCKSDRTESQHSFVQNVDGNVTEIYAGEWKNDKRCGYGVCSRSDGLKYEGEWYNNKKNGCGITTYQDGWVEEGKYKDNLLVTALTSKKSSIFAIRMLRLKDQVDSAVSEAKKASQIAVHKTEVAQNRKKMARMKVELAVQSSEQAKNFSGLAYQVSNTCCNTTITDESLIDSNILQNTSISVYNDQKPEKTLEETSTKPKENSTSSFKLMFNNSLKRSFSRSKNSSNHSDKSKTNSSQEKKIRDSFNSVSQYSDARKTETKIISSMSPENRSPVLKQQYSFNKITSTSTFQTNNALQNATFSNQQKFQQEQTFFNKQNVPQKRMQQQIPQQQNPSFQQNFSPTPQTQQQNYQAQTFNSQQNSLFQASDRNAQQNRGYQTQNFERSRIKRNKDPFDVFIGSPMKPPLSTLKPPSFKPSYVGPQTPEPTLTVLEWLKAQIPWLLLVIANSLFALLLLWLLQRYLV